MRFRAAASSRSVATQLHIDQTVSSYPFVGALAEAVVRLALRRFSQALLFGGRRVRRRFATTTIGTFCWRAVVTIREDKGWRGIRPEWRQSGVERGCCRGADHAECKRREDLEHRPSAQTSSLVRKPPCPAPSAFRRLPHCAPARSGLASPRCSPPWYASLALAPIGWARMLPSEFVLRNASRLVADERRYPVWRRCVFRLDSDALRRRMKRCGRKKRSSRCVNVARRSSPMRPWCQGSAERSAWHGACSATFARPASLSARDPEGL